MCNCGGNIQFSNCVGNPACNCHKETFNNMVGMNNNMVGMNGFANATGEIQTLSTPQIKVQTTIPTIEVKAPTTTAPTTTKPTLGETIGKVADFSTGLLDLFGKKSTSTTSAPVPLPEEEKKVPVAVWIVVGGLLLLVVAFVIVKAAKK